MTRADLYDRFMNRKFGRGRKAYWYAKAILETGDPGAIDSLLAFTDQHSELAFYVVELLRQEESSQLGPWLQKHSHRPELVDWTDLGMGLSRSGWRDSLVADALMMQVLTTDDQDIRGDAIYAFVGIGTLEEIRTIAGVGDTTSDPGVRHSAIAAQTRFDVPEFNDEVRAVLQNPDRLTIRQLISLRVNHRYDFLPELQALLSQLRQTDPESHFIDNLEELIAELEEKKAEGIKPAAPLDYPNTTRADSTSTR